MKSGENFNTFSRRKFLQLGIAASIYSYITPLLISCKQQILQYIFRITGANHILGHRLWTKDFPKPTQTISMPIVIIGAGISGLSAGRQLKKNNLNTFKILELENRVGGNSGYGENQFSKFPLAAHYLPLPNPTDTELINFLREHNIITGFQNKLPIFDEEQLCSYPQERLFIKNNWQEDLIPKYGNSESTNLEFQRFFDRMSKIRQQKGSDGKYFFDIPIKNCSKDTTYQSLDRWTMKNWLDQNNFKSEELLEYVNYCCRDDFGLGIDNLSAWAGLFYFCARKNDIYNKDTVLTWPEGNGRLMQHLSSTIQDHIEKEMLVYDIKETSKGIEILAFDVKQQISIKYLADKVICASPQYINAYLLHNRKRISKIFEYAPWFTASITLKDSFYNDNLPLAWDNVVYKGKGLGYVYNQSQSITQVVENKVITYYYSFETFDTVKSRKKLFQMQKEDLEKIILEDLKMAHPSIEENIIDIQVYKIGHGMISPKPNFLFHPLLSEASKPIHNKIFFAHSDLSGISIFEEAFHRGIDVANTILHEKKLDT